VNLTTHVLDTSRGRPAAGIALRLEREDGGGKWRLVTQGRADPDGRAGCQVDQAGRYQLHFATGEYFGDNAFYPWVTVTFQIADPGEHYHVPLLSGPFGYSTYRGS
jgi:5-hydroxyisourate hydrolase